MTQLGPPDDITAERLFRLLLQAPRATLPVTLPLPGVAHGSYTVRALTPLEDAAAMDRAFAGPESEHVARLEGELIAASLYEGDRLAFGSGERIARLLDELEFALVRNVVLSALNRVSPSYRRSDTAAWFAKLCTGAAHWSNAQLAIPLAQCIDAGFKSGLPRPERYFGLTVGQLTDGHWLAFRAAHQVIIKAREK